MADGAQRTLHRIELNKEVWEVPVKYTDLVPIGSGAFGQVCSALNSESNTSVATKKLSAAFQSSVRAKQIYRKLKMLEHMNHENVIGLLDVFTPASSLDDFDELYFVTPLLGADLNNILKQAELSDDHVQFIVYQLLRGLKYIHSAGIVHKDLKPSNVAVNENCELKILDFGRDTGALDAMPGYVATRWYRAPEVMLNWMQHNQKVDIWSVGLYHGRVLTGKALFPGNDHIDQLTKIMQLVGKPSDSFLHKISSANARNYITSMPGWTKKDFGEYFPNGSPEATNLLEHLLTLDPEERFTAEQALAHPYFAKYQDTKDEPSSKPYDHSFEKKDLDLPAWKKLVYEETQNFKPHIPNTGM
uniref:mitogen-activated protein kinase n=1 Tax=Hydroides elegans TaxID=216498 RepID=D3UA30_HYDEL|nr:putative p38 mitogen proteinkinase [Hydroides elegans]